MEGYTGQSLTHRTLVARMDVERVAKVAAHSHAYARYA